MNRPDGLDEFGETVEQLLRPVTAHIDAQVARLDRTVQDRTAALQKALRGLEDAGPLLQKELELAVTSLREELDSLAAVARRDLEEVRGSLAGLVEQTERSDARLTDGLAKQDERVHDVGKRLNDRVDALAAALAATWAATAEQLARLDAGGRDAAERSLQQFERLVGAVETAGTQGVERSSKVERSLADLRELGGQLQEGVVLRQLPPVTTAQLESLTTASARLTADQATQARQTLTLRQLVLCTLVAHLTTLILVVVLLTQ